MVDVGANGKLDGAVVLFQGSLQQCDVVLRDDPRFKLHREFALGIRIQTKDHHAAGIHI